MFLVSANEMQRMDRQTIESFGIPGRVLMENAGRGAAEVLLHIISGSQPRVAIAAGRGNNGGDGFVIARYLSQKGMPVIVYLLSTQEQVKGDAAANLHLLSKLDIPVIEIPDEDTFSRYEMQMRHHTVWVDAIFGTGLNADVQGFYRKFIKFLNDLNKPILSVDIPSGLNTDTGQSCGVCVRAHTTVTFAHPKIGHYLYPGAEYTGYLEIIDIGIPRTVAEAIRPKQHLLTPDILAAKWIARSPDAHKGNAGHMLVLAGSLGKTGAAVLTATAAMRAGAGLVTLGIPKSLNPVLETLVCEAMTSPLPESEDGSLGESAFDDIMALLLDKKCLAIGPGLGQRKETRQLIHRILLECPCPIVIDADGLNCLSEQLRLLQNVSVPLVLTPHPGEMAKLIGNSTSNIQKDRITYARSVAEAYQVHMVLKGARTVIAHPNGEVYVNPTGNAGMASGGMGDVLTGLIAGWICQGYLPEHAVHMGVYFHGKAADTLAETRGPIGFLASEVRDMIPEEIKRFLHQSFSS